jgi:hypothetical protein
VDEKETQIEKFQKYMPAAPELIKLILESKANIEMERRSRIPAPVEGTYPTGTYEEGTSTRPTNYTDIAISTELYDDHEEALASNEGVAEKTPQGSMLEVFSGKTCNNRFQ